MPGPYLNCRGSGGPMGSSHSVSQENSSVNLRLYASHTPTQDDTDLIKVICNGYLKISS